MKNKIQKLFACMLLCTLLLTLIIPAAAAEEETEPPVEAKVLTISSMEDFLRFRESCIRDIYSENLTVELKTDLDFTDMEFEAVPSFSGTFNGNRHTIKGIGLNTEGSSQGLFRYVRKGAVIRDLTVQGEILPTGSKNAVGGIAGTNEGLIKNCKFGGTVSGTESIGGIAGINLSGGILENCAVSGVIRGKHFAGGIAGENYGVIRSCKNLSSINVREEDNKIESVSFDPDFIMGKEAIDTATDLGGIAGVSSGMIRDSENHGNVGYPRMGYNIGGICGSQKGYVTGCKNYGTIQGRKEIAGIAGQLEPVIEISYEEDTLQILRRQLNTTSALANRASGNIRAGSQGLKGDIQDLHGSAETAVDAIHELIPQNGEFPDRDTIIAAQNTLSSSISSMHGSISNINESAQSLVGTAAADIRAINNSIADISNTLDHAGENLGGTITDVSDEDTEDMLTGKIQDCHNAGFVSGDLNVGGIVGAAAWENDKDPEEDLTVSGDRSFHFDSRLRAVILDCSNSAEIQAHKRHAGGIAGNLTLGLVRNCVNTGFIDGEGADYIGGIAGTSQGFIRNCSVKAKLAGNSYMGGIAGSASIVSDCRSTILLDGGAERLGSVIGFPEENRTETDTPIERNFYLPLADHLGAIDGIDYYGQADSLGKLEFLSLEGLSPLFQRASMTFRYPDGSTQKLTVPMGDVVPQEKIPAPPRKDGYLSSWDLLDELDLNHMFFDVTLNANYTPVSPVAESSLTRWDGKPILLAEGSFPNENILEFKENSEKPQGHEILGSWLLPDFGTDQDTILHLSVTENMDSKNGRVLIQGSDGKWRDAEVSEDGTYLVFSVHDSDQAVALYESHAGQLASLLSIGGIIAVLLIVLIVIFAAKKRKKKAKPSKA